MNKATNKPGASENPSPYEELCGKPLTKEQEAEMHFNLVNFVETLIAMDRQKQEWDKNKKQQSKEV
jgi:hypothetical protein